LETRNGVGCQLGAPCESTEQYPDTVLPKREEWTTTHHGGSRGQDAPAIRCCRNHTMRVSARPSACQVSPGPRETLTHHALASVRTAWNYRATPHHFYLGPHHVNLGGPPKRNVPASHFHRRAGQHAARAPVATPTVAVAASVPCVGKVTGATSQWERPLSTISASQ